MWIAFMLCYAAFASELSFNQLAMGTSAILSGAGSNFTLTATDVHITGRLHVGGGVIEPGT
jgi:hypothetical protein